MSNSINFSEIYYVGTEKTHRSETQVKIQYEGYPPFFGFFWLPAHLRKKVIQLNKKASGYELVLARNREGNWSLSHSSCPSVTLIEIPDSAFSSLELGWLMPTAKGCPVYNDIRCLQSDKRKTEYDFLWLKYRGFTFHNINAKKIREIMRGIVTGKFIFPDDERITEVYRNPKGYLYSRDGILWQTCPNDIRYLSSPRRCIFAKQNH